MSQVDHKHHTHVVQRGAGLMLQASPSQGL